MSLLSIIQSHCKMNALAIPTSVIGSTSTQVIQLYEILKDVCDEIVTQSKFQAAQFDSTFLSQNSEFQGWLAVGATPNIAPLGYQWLIPDTLYNRSRKLKILGPLSDEEWQALHAMAAFGSALCYYRIWSDGLYFYPPPAAGDTIAFEYASFWYALSAAPALTLKEFPDNDTDGFFFPEALIKRGLSARWKQVKGLPYQVDETKYYDMLNNYIARDKAKTTINVSNQCRRSYPGVMVPLWDSVP